MNNELLELIEIGEATKPGEELEREIEQKLSNLEEEINDEEFKIFLSGEK